MKLNPEQQKAVDHVDGPLLILAGAGSGKTRVLVNRIAKLIGDGTAHPSEVLAVTFTNKAAGEMRKRLEEMLGYAMQDLWVGTFHGMCLRMLRQHAERIGLGPHFVVYDDSDQMALIKDVLSLLNISDKAVPPRSALERISRAKDGCQSPEEFAKGAHDFYLGKIAKIYEKYQARLTESQAVDFGDIIRLTVRLLEENPEICAHYQARFRFLLVDEYQDTNHAQYRFVSLLAKGHGNICVVGDDDQSIYRWRGADVGNILSFERDFPGAVVVRLEQNYRSTQTILDAANGVISNNTGRKPKTLWTENNVGDRVCIVENATDRQEAEEVGSRISKLRDDGAQWRDIAVFYRINAQSRTFEDVFRREGVPYQIIGGVRFYERREIKDVVAYLRLMHDVRDDVALARIINVPSRRIGKQTIDKLKAYAGATNSNIYDAIGAFCDQGMVSSAVAKRLVAFKNLIENLRSVSQGVELGEIVREVLEKTGYIEMLVADKTDEANDRLENISELVSAAGEYKTDEERTGLQAFLDQVALVSDVDSFDSDSGAVTLMTMHLAKGLEFPHVYMVGMEENLFPHARSMDDPDELEEERRLCYVGMTRAMERLTMMYALRRFHFGQHKFGLASRFLEEIPEKFVEWKKKRDYAKSFFPSRSQMPDAGYQMNNTGGAFTGHGSRVTGHDTDGDFDYDFDQSSSEDCMPQGYAKGMQVSHPSFGDGVIKQCERTPSGHKVTVQFRSGFTKRLIAELANLMPL